MKYVNVDIPAYAVDEGLSWKKIAIVGREIDRALVDNFAGKKVVLRAISSLDHTLGRDELIEKIKSGGTDRHDSTIAGDRYENIEGKRIDLFGRTVTISSGKKLSRFLLAGFHVWVPKTGYKQRKMDIWLVYDRSKLKSVLHSYEKYHINKRDGYVFIDPGKKAEALLGMLVIK